VAAFEEDFNVERREKMQQKEYYDKLIGQHQEWVRRLANEVRFNLSLSAFNDSSSCLNRVLW